MSNNIESIQNQEDLEYQHNIERSIKASSYIKLSLADGPLIQTKYITNSFLLWRKLRELYSSSGFSSEFLLCKELVNCNLTNSKNNLENYINNFTRIINSLKAKDINLPDKFIAAFILNNLNKDFDYLVASIT